MNAADNQALAGLRVLDITQVMAGPVCTMLLADLGADVVKIEPPDGDWTRQLPGAIGTDSPPFNAVNRGKRSIVVNLKVDAGRDVVRRLARSADILVENHRPGVMNALGLDYATLAALNRRLIYASISGYGHTGPSRAKGGFDLVAQGVAGIMSVTGEPGGRPTKAGVPITDMAAALYATVGVLAALHYRERTGVGQFVDTSLVDAGVALSVWEATEYFCGFGIPAPMGSAHRNNAPYQAIRCADGYITVGAGTDRLFRRLCDVLNHPEWADAPAFANTESRVRNRAVLADLIESISAERSTGHWLELFDAHDIPCGPINDYAQVFADPQVLAREMVVDIEHPGLGHLRTLGSPMKLTATPVDVRRPAPRLGEHTDELLAEAGYTEREIAALRDSRAVK